MYAQRTREGCVKGLSPKQKEVLAAIETATQAGERLSVRELADRMGVGSTCTMHQHLKALERKGFLRPAEGRHRSIEMVNPPGTCTDISFYGMLSADGRAHTPLFGADAMRLPKELSGEGEAFLFEVGDDEMPGVRAGDLVVVRATEAPRQGDLVVAEREGQRAVRRWPIQEGTLVGRVAVIIRQV